MKMIPLLFAGILLSQAASAQTWTYLGLGGHEVFSIQSRGPNLYAGTNHGIFTKGRAGSDTTWSYMSLAAYEIDDFEIVNDLIWVVARYDRVADESVIVRSTDGGFNWTTVYDPGAYVFFDIEMRDDLPDTLYSCAWTGGVYKSTNAGLTWSPLPAPVSITWDKVKISPSNTQHLLAGGESPFFASKLFESMNGGQTWTDRPALGSPGADNAVYGIDIDPTDENRWHLGMEDYTALSINGGSSWSFLNFAGSGFKYSFDTLVDPLEPSRVFYLGFNYFSSTNTVLDLAVSGDQGQSWTLLINDPGYGHGEAWDLELVVEGGSTSAYFAGRGVYRVGPFALSASPETVEGNFVARLSQPFPRTGRLVIPYQVGEAGTPLGLAVFDLQGRPIHRFPATIAGAGAHEAVWSGLDDEGRVVSRGIYFVRLDSPGVTISRKVSWPGR